MVNGSPRLCGVFLFLHSNMRKKSHKLVKSILSEAVGEPGAHTWEVPHPQTAWEALTPEQQSHVNSLHQQGRLHPEGHLHGWRPGTGPLFGRDFAGRSHEDYRNLHRQYRQELVDAGHDPKTAHETAARYVQHDRQRAHEAGVVAHSTAMSEIRANEKKQKQAAQNVSGAQQQQQYQQDAETLHRMALQGARHSEEYFRSGTQAVHDAANKKYGSGPDDQYLNDIYPHLSEEGKNHLSTLSRMARQAIHTTVIGGLNRASEGLNADAREHWRKTFSGMSPTDAGIRSPHDVLFSALRPEHVRHMIDRFSKNHVTSDPTNLGGIPGMGHHSTAFLQTADHSLAKEHDRSEHHYGRRDMSGSPGHLNLHTTIPIDLNKPSHLRNPFHPSIQSHVSVNPSMFHDLIGHLVGREKFKTGSTEYKFRSEIPNFGSQQKTDAENAATQETAKTLYSGIKTGTDFIKNLQGISDDDRKILFRHFESQLRHHHVAAVAHPKMYDAHHQGKTQQEREAEERQRKQREEQQRQSSGGSGGSSGGSGRRRRGEWPHPEQPHEILGVAQDAGPDEIRRAYRKLSVTEHPDNKVGEIDPRGVWRRLDQTGHDSHHAELQRLTTQFKKLKDSSDINDWRKSKDIEKQIGEMDKIGQETAQRHFASNAGQEIVKKHEEARELAGKNFAKVAEAYEHMMKKHGLNEWVIFTAEWIAKRYRK